MYFEIIGKIEDIETMAAFGDFNKCGSAACEHR